MPSRSSCTHTTRPRRVPAAVGADRDLDSCPSSTGPFEYEPDSAAADIQRPAGELGVTVAEDDAVGGLFDAPRRCTRRVAWTSPSLSPVGRRKAAPLHHRANLASILLPDARRDTVRAAYPAPPRGGYLALG